MKGTLHRGSVCPPAGGGREDNRCLKHTQPLRDASGRPPCLSRSVLFLPRQSGARLSRACRDSQRCRRRLIGLGGTSPPPADLRLSLIPSGEPASRPTRSPSQAKGYVPLSHCTVITGDGLFVAGLVRSSVWNKQHWARQHF